MHFPCWDLPTDGVSSLRFLTDLALTHLQECKSTQALSLSNLISESDWTGVLGFELKYDTDKDAGLESVMDYIHIRQALALFSKNKDLPVVIDREAVALSKFEAAEAQCLITNQCFRAWSAGRFQFRPSVEGILHSCQRKIATLLGECPNFDEVSPRFGPGATVDLKKSSANPRSKIDRVQSCSEAFVPLVPSAFRSMEALFSLHGVKSGEAPPDSFSDTGYDVYTVPVRVSAGRLSFVPKSAKTDRAIVVEPSLNGMFQMAYGDLIAKKLRRWGVDIRDQTLNQRLAREGSITGGLATLDLSNASDTIATELVAHLLPLPWFSLLERLRSREITYGERVFLLEKFSSMGNGFTFPLETMIFFAVAKSYCEYFDIPGEIMVYGDDMVVPSSAALGLSRVLHELGFSVNLDKSFSSGHFRESCGKDYYSGIDIRPCYIKETVTPASLFTLHNFYVEKHLTSFASVVAKAIPKHLRLWGPPAYGDGHLHTTSWSGCAHLRTRGWAGFTFDTWSRKSRYFTKALPGDWVFPLYSIYRIPPESTETKSQTPSGSWLTPLPGTKGVKRISIYTLLPPPTIR